MSQTHKPWTVVFTEHLDASGGFASVESEMDFSTEEEAREEAKAHPDGRVEFREHSSDD